MSVTLKIPPPLRSLTGGKNEVEVDATDISSALTALDQKHPGIAICVRNEQGEPRKHILIFINNDDIRERQGMQSPLRSGDVVFIMPAVSGG
jgi:molybdopterin synthase sulfur carrier subunit